MEQDIGQLKKIILGLRHVRTFKVADILGDIIDLILPLQGHTPFPAECFGLIERPDAYSIILRNTDKDVILNMNIDGVILHCDISPETGLTAKTVTSMFSEIASLVIPASEGKNKINRLGIAHEYIVDLSIDNSAEKIFSTFLNFNTKGIPDKVQIKFALKYPTKAALFDPRTKTDYKNMHIEISSNKAEEDKEGFPTLIKMTYDFQHYYHPKRTFADIDIEQFVSDAQTHMKEHIINSPLNVVRKEQKVG